MSVEEVYRICQQHQEEYIAYKDQIDKLREPGRRDPQYQPRHTLPQGRDIDSEICDDIQLVNIHSINITSLKNSHHATLRYPGIVCIQEHQTPIGEQARYQTLAAQKGIKLHLTHCWRICVPPLILFALVPLSIIW